MPNGEQSVLRALAPLERRVSGAVSAMARATLTSAMMVLGLVACASAPPVQEMSDARQAIAAAREAGADTHSPEALSRAEARLTAAESDLQSGTYWSARKAALEAKESAIEALLRARSVRDAESRGSAPASR